jgi:hypothetical protein
MSTSCGYPFRSAPDPVREVVKGSGIDRLGVYRTALVDGSTSWHP